MYNDYLILGGAGLVGLQVCRHIAALLPARRIVVASLHAAEAEAACEQLEQEYGDRVAFVPESGNLFVPKNFAHTPRSFILSDSAKRKELIRWLYGCACYSPTPRTPQYCLELALR